MQQTEEVKNQNQSNTEFKSKSVKEINGIKSPVIPMSIMAANCLNPIRRLVDQMKLEPNPEKNMIPLSIGDPTVFGNLKCDELVTEAVVEALKSGKYNGYAPCTGYEEARQAIAKYSNCNNYTLTSSDILITSGCSSALEHCILVLANPGQNILVPRPGFPLYKTICHASGINVKYYNLIPEKEWEVDIENLDSEIDSDTVAILVNNPSNPCGSVYSREHLIEILAIAEKHELPIIADEIYSFVTFEGMHFEFMASLNERVSILSCNGLTKRFLCPGWRLGWIVIYDNQNRFKEIRQGLHDLATRTIGANTIVQGALPKILFGVSEDHFKSTLKVIKENYDIVESILFDVPGLVIVKPRGAMYVMIKVEISRFKSFAKNQEFIENMVKEESVFCLPSEVFEIDNYFRILLTLPPDIMAEACQRIKSYCLRHISKPNTDL